MTYNYIGFFKLIGFLVKRLKVKGAYSSSRESISEERSTTCYMGSQCTRLQGIVIWNLGTWTLASKFTLSIPLVLHVCFAYTRISFILPETRVPELHYSCYSMGLTVFHFTQLKANKRCSRRALMRDPTVIYVFFLENPSEYPHKPHLARNKSSCRKFAQLTTCVNLYQFSRNYFSKVARSEPAKPARKPNLTRNSHSGLFKVIYCGITEKLTTDAYRYIITRASSLKFQKK